MTQQNDPLAHIKNPPHSIEAEYAVLGGLLIDNAAWDKIADKLGERDFYIGEHRVIFRAIAMLVGETKPADVVTVAELLERHGKLESAGGLSALVALTSNTPSAANIVRYAEIVRDKAMLRSVISTTNDIQDKAYSQSGMSPKDVLDYAQSRMLNLTESAGQQAGGPEDVKDVMRGVIEHIDAMYHRDNQDDVTGLHTGYAELDKMTTGLQPGELIIVAARPSMGKTGFSLNVAEHVAIQQKKNVLFFSLEMINQQLGIRLLASVAKINQQRVKVGRLYDQEWQRVTDALGKLTDSVMFLDESSNLNVTEIRARARRLHRECGGLHLVVIDYLQLIQTSGKSDNRAFELAEVSRSLKMLAKELHVPVIALSQLNRGLEQRPNKRPIMSDLRDSGGIEQDADLILFIYRDEVYHDETPDKGIAELIVGKQRNGPTGTVHVNFKGELIRFEDRPKHDLVPSKVERQERRDKRQQTRPPRPNFRDIDGGGYVDM